MLCPKRSVVRNPVDQRLHSFGLHAVKDAAPLPSSLHEAGGVQRRQMLRNRRLGNAEARRQFTNRRFAVRQRLKNRAPARIGERVEDGVLSGERAMHHVIISEYLFMRNEKRRGRLTERARDTMLGTSAGMSQVAPIQQYEMDMVVKALLPAGAFLFFAGCVPGQGDDCDPDGAACVEGLVCVPYSGRGGGYCEVCVDEGHPIPEAAPYCPAPSGGATSCTSSTGICTEFVSGDADAFAAQCSSEGNTSGSACGESYEFSCSGAHSTANGADVIVDIHWPNGFCAANPTVDLQGTCDTLNGSATGTPCG